MARRLWHRFLSRPSRLCYSARDVTSRDGGWRLGQLGATPVRLGTCAIKMYGGARKDRDRVPPVIRLLLPYVPQVAGAIHNYSITVLG